ncbi:MAG: type II methionyl aminopeptidase [Methanobacteriota archaeon]|nr:MAG: type II methionyl aminopeptidase [Euryarchaeota archaeon]
MEQKAKEILEKYREAGRISIEAKKLVERTLKPGKNAFEFAQEIEGFIRKQGASPSFPLNFSVNNEAAHYSPDINDTRTVGKADTIKVDLGAHVDGYIVDTAITVNFNKKYDDMTKVTKEALDAAIDKVKAGVKVMEIGAVIEKTIADAGYEPIRNLSGHQIKRFVLHAGQTIPNHGSKIFGLVKGRLEKGKVYAIEPFATDGRGEVKNGRKMNIFRVIRKPKPKETELAKILKKYIDKVGILPFSPRFLMEEDLTKDEITRDIRKLLRAKIIMGYPVLVEVDPKANVSQFEHTIIVKSDGCEILT